MSTGANKRQLAFFLTIGGISTIAAGAAMTFLIQPPFVGLIVIATSFIEFITAAYLWRTAE